MFGLDLNPKPGEPIYPSDDVPSDEGGTFYLVLALFVIALLFSLPGYLLYLLVQGI